MRRCLSLALQPTAAWAASETIGSGTRFAARKLDGWQLQRTRSLCDINGFMGKLVRFNDRAPLGQTHPPRRHENVQKARI